MHSVESVLCILNFEFLFRGLFVCVVQRTELRVLHTLGECSTRVASPALCGLKLPSLCRCVAAAHVGDYGDLFCPFPEDSRVPGLLMLVPYPKPTLPKLLEPDLPLPGAHIPMYRSAGEPKL